MVPEEELELPQPFQIYSLRQKIFQLLYIHKKTGNDPIESKPHKWGIFLISVNNSRLK